MKITGKIDKVKALYSLYIAVGLLVIAVPVRLYQVFGIIEPDTGFYALKDWSVYLMYALCAAAVLAPYILTTLAKNVPASKPLFRKSIYLSAASFLLAAGIIVDSVTAFSHILVNIKSFGEMDLSFMQSMLQGQLPLALEVIFGALSAIYILIFGISYIDGKTTYSQHRFLALAPLFWAMSRIVLRFLRKISYINVSDLMLELFAIAFMMLFFLAFARISSGLSADRAMRSLFSAGFAGAFFCLAANLPRGIALLTGNGGFIPTEYPFSLCDFAFGLFALAYIVNSVSFAKENDSAELNRRSEKDAPSDDTDADGIE